jgi:hypothetical protein
MRGLFLLLNYAILINLLYFANTLQILLAKRPTFEL